MEQELYLRFKDLIYRESGINLGSDKKELLNNRVQKRLRKLGIKEPGQYLKMVETDLSGEELVELLDVVSTNLTFFYREPQHFELYTRLLKEWYAAGKRSFRIWCAASSSGEEPYTLAFLAQESIDLKQADLKILATDISTRVLRKAIEGIYELKQFEKMPPSLFSTYFKKANDGENSHYQVIPEIKRLVSFKRLNLIESPLPLKGPIDIIFCRNVMIYFDVPTRAKIISEFERILRPGGYLMLGHSENLLGITHALRGRGVATFEK